MNNFSLTQKIKSEITTRTLLIHLTLSHNVVFNCNLYRIFTFKEVEPMYRESDHIHVIALTSVINIAVSIIYLDRTDQIKAIPHNFPEGSEPKLYILYRPGHYDIIYE